MTDSRTPTWGSHFSSNSFANKAGSSNKQSWVPEEYPWYHISWEKLRAWLERNFPNPPTPYPEHELVMRSNYQFLVPHKLTEAERKSIEKEHDIPTGRKTKRAVSPGG